jgi:hypothetical protein
LHFREAFVVGTQFCQLRTIELLMLIMVMIVVMLVIL